MAIVNFAEQPGSVPRVFYAASNGGALYVDLQGKILKHHRLGHVQNPAIADFRPDLPGLGSGLHQFCNYSNDQATVSLPGWSQ